MSRDTSARGRLWLLLLFLWISYSSGSMPATGSGSAFRLRCVGFGSRGRRAVLSDITACSRERADELLAPTSHELTVSFPLTANETILSALALELSDRSPTGGADGSIVWIDRETFLQDNNVVHKLSTAMQSVLIQRSLQSTAAGKSPLIIALAAPIKLLNRLQTHLRDAYLVATTAVLPLQPWISSSSTVTPIQDVFDFQVVICPSAVAVGDGELVLSPQSIATVQSFLQKSIHRWQSLQESHFIAGKSNDSSGSLIAKVSHSRLSSKASHRSLVSVVKWFSAKWTHWRPSLVFPVNAIPRFASLQPIPRNERHIDILADSVDAAVSLTLSTANSSIAQLNAEQSPDAFAANINALLRYGLQTLTEITAAQVNRTLDDSRAMRLAQEELLRVLSDRFLPLFRRQVALLRASLTNEFNQAVQEMPISIALIDDMRALQRQQLSSFVRQSQQLLPPLLFDYFDPLVAEECDVWAAVHDSRGSWRGRMQSLLHSLTRSWWSTRARTRRNKSIRSRSRSRSLLSQSQSLPRQRQSCQVYAKWTVYSELQSFAQTLDDFIRLRETSLRISGVLPRGHRLPLSVSIHSLITHPLGLRDHSQDVLGDCSTSGDVFVFDKQVSPIKALVASGSHARRQMLAAQRDAQAKDTSTSVFARFRRQLTAGKWLPPSALDEASEFAREMLMLPWAMKHPDTLHMNLRRRQGLSDMTYSRRDPVREKFPPERFIRWDIAPMSEAHSALEDVRLQSESYGKAHAEKATDHFFNAAERWTNQLINTVPMLKKGFYRSPVITYGPNYEPRTTMP